MDNHVTTFQVTFDSYWNWPWRILWRTTSSTWRKVSALRWEPVDQNTTDNVSVQLVWSACRVGPIVTPPYAPHHWVTRGDISTIVLLLGHAANKPSSPNKSPAERAQDACGIIGLPDSYSNLKHTSHPLRAAPPHVPIPTLRPCR